MIVHLPDRAWLEQLAEVPKPDRQTITNLAERFWPGPFTIILPKRAIVPEIVTAGLETVAIRISAHPVFDEIVRLFGKPVAAPSANRFGRISPTTAQHVFGELDGLIPLIVDAGATTHGIESTIVTVRDKASKKLETYTILGAWDGDPDRNIISYQTAIGQALLGHKAGEVVAMNSDQGTSQFEIVSIEPAPVDKPAAETINETEPASV